MNERLRKLQAYPTLQLAAWERAREADRGDGADGAGAVAGLVAGAATVIGWIALGWNADFFGGPGLYEIIPGFIAAWIAIVAVSRMTAKEG